LLIILTQSPIQFMPTQIITLPFWGSSCVPLALLAIRPAFANCSRDPCAWIGQIAEKIKLPPKEKQKAQWMNKIRNPVAGRTRCAGRWRFGDTAPRGSERGGLDLGLVPLLGCEFFRSIPIPFTAIHANPILCFSIIHCNLYQSYPILSLSIPIPSSEFLCWRVRGGGGECWDSDPRLV
jgi:hypothetical protein